MKIGLHITSFSWPDAPASIAPTLAGVAAAADEAGISELSFMDHWFQMDVWRRPLNRCSRATPASATWPRSPRG